MSGSAGKKRFRRFNLIGADCDSYGKRINKQVTSKLLQKSGGTVGNCICSCRPFCLLISQPRFFNVADIIQTFQSRNNFRMCFISF